MIQDSRRHAADGAALRGRELRPLGSVLELEPRAGLGGRLASISLRAIHSRVPTALVLLLVCWLLWRRLAARAHDTRSSLAT